MAKTTRDIIIFAMLILTIIFIFFIILPTDLERQFNDKMNNIHQQIKQTVDYTTLEKIAWITLQYDSINMGKGWTAKCKQQLFNEVKT